MQIVLRDRKASTSYIQRKLGIGYNKAARLVEQMEEQGVVTPANHVGKREILIPELIDGFWKNHRPAGHGEQLGHGAGAALADPGNAVAAGQVGCAFTCGKVLA